MSFAKHMENFDYMDDMISQAVILAGGYGTRLQPFTNTMPKPMYPIMGKPFLEYLILQIKSFGINEVVLLLGYLPDKVIDYFGDGSKWGIHIKYSITPVEFETGARLRGAKDLLCDVFFMLYCDNYCPINYSKLEHDYFTNNALVQTSMYSNGDSYTKNNLYVDDNGLVECYDKSRTASGLNGVDIGYAIVNKAVFSELPETNINFEASIYPQMVARKKIYATVTHHRYYSIGSWERIKLTERFFSDRKYIFLDRDGTLNVRPQKACYVEKPDDFLWLDGAKDAVKRLNDAGYTILLVTNQPGIARDRLTEETLGNIHDKLLHDLANIGAHIDKIYYCPHNWDEGCFCRKPNPGMLYQAQRDFSFDLTKAILIGDDERDIAAGEAAGCKCYLVTEQNSLLDQISHILLEKHDEVKA